MTHKEFASFFKPMPGTHDVVLIHGQRQPVNVAFICPAGQLKTPHHGFPASA